MKKIICCVAVLAMLMEVLCALPVPAAFPGEEMSDAAGSFASAESAAANLYFPGEKIVKVKKEYYQSNQDSRPVLYREYYYAESERLVGVIYTYAVGDDYDCVIEEYLDFDQYGNPARMLKRGYIDGVPVKEIDSFKYEYVYDGAGNILVKEETCLSVLISGQYVTVRTEYVYDDSGLLQMKSNFEFIGGWIYYSYDSNDNLIRTEDDDGGLTDYEYGADGRLLEKKYYHNGELSSIYKYSYNDHGDVIKEERYKVSGVQTYRGENALTDDELYETYTYEYEYYGSEAVVEDGTDSSLTDGTDGSLSDDKPGIEDIIIISDSEDEESSGFVIPDECMAAYQELLASEYDAIHAYGKGTSYGGEARPNVVLCDICGDETPELLYVALDDSYSYSYDDTFNQEDWQPFFLHIVTYENSTLRELYSGEVDKPNNAAGVEGFYLFQMNDEKTLYEYFINGNGDNLENEYYYKFIYTDSGDLIQEQICRNEKRYDYDLGEYHNSYSQKGQGLTFSEYLDIVKDLQSRTGSLLMYGSGWTGQFAADHALPQETSAKMIDEWGIAPKESAETAEDAEPDMEAINHAEIGDTVYFGSYEQDNNPLNGQEPVEWEVLGMQQDRVLLLSKYALASVPYNTSDMKITWEKCTLRKWLNDDFLNRAFSPAEQERIATTRIVNADNPLTGVEGGEDTYDQVFLLSLDDIKQFYGIAPEELEDPHEELQCRWTEYGRRVFLQKSAGSRRFSIYLVDNYDDPVSWYKDLETEYGRGICRFWTLRSPGDIGYAYHSVTIPNDHGYDDESVDDTAEQIVCELFISIEGTIAYVKGMTFDMSGIRPAIWVTADNLGRSVNSVNSENDSWQKAYLNFLNNDISGECPGASDMELWDMNNDQIPELIVASGNVSYVYTYQNGGVVYAGEVGLTENPVPPSSASVNPEYPGVFDFTARGMCPYLYYTLKDGAVESVKFMEAFNVLDEHLNEAFENGVKIEYYSMSADFGDFIYNNANLAYQTWAVSEPSGESSAETSGDLAVDAEVDDIW